MVGFNLMQIADRTIGEIEELTRAAVGYPINVLYFADSMGGMTPNRTAEIIRALREHWSGEIGIHAHDNMGLALSNTLRAIDEGVTWIDATVTGMGRGSGNTQTEYLAIEVAQRRQQDVNLTPLLGLISRTFAPLQQQYSWGTNTYYYLAGKYDIHPSYVQSMVGDARYSVEDILAVIEQLRADGGKRFSLGALDSAKQFYQGKPRGTWNPATYFQEKEVLLLGTGPGVATHRDALEKYVRQAKPIVMALNTQSQIEPDLIDLRVACHPVRLLADCDAHSTLPQPLITPASMLPANVRAALGEKELLDYGLGIQANTFEFNETYCILPTALVIAYALAIAASGRASRIVLAGFDGYENDDPRNREMDELFMTYNQSSGSVELSSCTATRYRIPSISIYGLL